MIGKILSPLLEEMEDILWEFEANNGCPPHFTEGGFRASMKNIYGNPYGKAVD